MIAPSSRKVLAKNRYRVLYCGQKEVHSTVPWPKRGTALYLYPERAMLHLVSSTGTLFYAFCYGTPSALAVLLFISSVPVFIAGRRCRLPG